MRSRDDDKAGAEAVSALIVEVFRLNGSLLEAGDRLVRHLGLTSARWQILGAIDAAKAALPVAHIARNMGLSRQAVQRLANEMAAGGLVRFTANPHHERAKLVIMTAKGETAFRAAMQNQRRWAAALVESLPADEIDAARMVIHTLRTRLEEG